MLILYKIFNYGIFIMDRITKIIFKRYKSIKKSLYKMDNRMPDVIVYEPQPPLPGLGETMWESYFRNLSKPKKSGKKWTRSEAPKP